MQTLGLCEHYILGLVKLVGPSSGWHTQDEPAPTLVTLHLLECGHSLGSVSTCTKPIVFLTKNLDHFNECESTIFHNPL
jgi:hypothetical protein